MQQVTDSLLFQFTLNEILRALKMLKFSPECCFTDSSIWSFANSPLKKLHTYFSLLEKDSLFLSRIEHLLKDHDAQKLEKLLKTISSHLFKRISFRDENLLLFLLKRREEFDDVHGKHFIADKLKNLFPDDNMEAWISERYLARGFFHLLPSIKQHLREI